MLILLLILEGQLDEVEEGKQEWVSIIDEFYQPFSDEVKELLKN